MRSRRQFHLFIVAGLLCFPGANTAMAQSTGQFQANASPSPTGSHGYKSVEEYIFSPAGVSPRGHSCQAVELGSPFGLAAKDPPGTVTPTPASQNSQLRRIFHGPRHFDVRLAAPKFRFEQDRSYRLWLIWETRPLHADLVLSSLGLHQASFRWPTELFGVKFDPGLSLHFSEDGTWPTTVSLQGRTRIREFVYRPIKADTEIEGGLMQFEAWRELPLHGRSGPFYRYAISLPPSQTGRVIGIQAEQVLLASVPVLDYPKSPTTIVRGRARRNMYDPLPKELYIREYLGPYVDWPAYNGRIKIWFAARNSTIDWFFRVSYQTSRM